MAVSAPSSSKKSGLFKPHLSLSQIINMNVGFLGIQYSFGLQQTAINPIFSFLGADHHDLPLLNLAGPVTGLLIQPIIGAISDKTWSPKWGRRKPFFLVGAFLASLCLFLFPFSSTLWFAVGLLWVLDAANNTAMEPYRAFVGDKLNDKQLPLGFQMQSLFVGAGILLANFSLYFFKDWFPSNAVESAICAADAKASSIPRWVYYSFFLGAVASVVTILWSVLSTPEIPPSDEEYEEIKAFNKGKPNPLIQILSALMVVLSVPLLVGMLLAQIIPYLKVNYNLLVVIMLLIGVVWLYFLYKSIKNNPDNPRMKRLGDLLMPILEAAEAIEEMPKLMKQLSVVYFFQWYALFIYWQFITPMLRQGFYGLSLADENKAEAIKEACKAGESVSAVDMGFLENVQQIFEQALAQTGLMNGTYNFVTMVVALALVPLAIRFSSKLVYVLSLALTGIAMLTLPNAHETFAFMKGIPIPFIDENVMPFLIPMVFFGIGWACMMGIPYSMVTKVIPADRRGVYMGIVNMMIVIPMLIQTVSFGPIVKHALKDSAINAIVFGGVFFIIAAVLALFLQERKDKLID